MKNNKEVRSKQLNCMYSMLNTTGKNKLTDLLGVASKEIHSRLHTSEDINKQAHVAFINNQNHCMTSDLKKCVNGLTGASHLSMVAYHYIEEDRYELARIAVNLNYLTKEALSIIDHVILLGHDSLGRISVVA